MKSNKDKNKRNRKGKKSVVFSSQGSDTEQECEGSHCPRDHTSPPGNCRLLERLPESLWLEVPPEGFTKMKQS